MSSSVQDGIQVLHVDDEPGFPDLTDEFLEREEEEFSVVVATDTSEALDIIHDNKPDCVVSDFDMSGLNGLQSLTSTDCRKYSAFAGEAELSRRITKAVTGCEYILTRTKSTTWHGAAL